MSEDIPCPICQAKSAAEIARQPEDYEYSVKPDRNFRFYDCLSCKTRFLFPRPTDEEVVSFHPQDYWAYNKEQTKLLNALLQVRLAFRMRAMQRKVGRKCIRLFDVGTGDYSHFDAMRSRGTFEFCGVEINPQMVEIARSKGYDVKQGSLENLDISQHTERFDIVTMYHLLEHAVDPQTLLAKARSLLRPGGCLLGQLPILQGCNAKIFGRYWSIYHYPRHLQIPSRTGLAGLLERTGFQHVKFSAAFSLDTALSIQNFMLGKLKRRPRLTFGKIPHFNLLFLATIPAGIIEYALRQGSVMDFEAFAE